ncbi:hypothetical protein [uncultured Tenacibaculum sp.]|uniref:hypothetical protein n=1 Tax=uncultured Tenacibaculum sp. TaxID=174713 RepID=UPI002607CD31|nr:hypothetical protein [uncultured Tenacibaculum sp.]
MRPKIKKEDFLNADDEWLVQLIGQTTDVEINPNITNQKKDLYYKRIQLCNLIIQIEFTIESYGQINFFIDYSHEIPDLIELKELLYEFNEREAVDAIDKTLLFYHNNKKEFDYLTNAIEPANYDLRHKQLEEKYYDLENTNNGVAFYIPLCEPIENLAKYIRLNPNEFLVDENGVEYNS